MAYPGGMELIEIAVDEAVLRKAQRCAEQRGSTVERMVRDHLEDIARKQGDVSVARRRIRELAAESRMSVGPRNWTRGDLHER